MATSSPSSTPASILGPRQHLSQPIDRRVGLDGVPNDIHYLIASELMESSPSAARALGQSSKTLHQATLPIVFRNLVLKKSPKESQTLKAYQTLIESFRTNGNGEIARHVRSLTVKDDLPEEDLMLVLNAISSSGVLRKMSWTTTAHMPGAVLEKLHGTWPDLELSVCVLDRQNAPIALHQKMDIRLLSSPLLKNLAYNVYFQGYRPEEPAPSEWPELTKALVAGGNVRVLKIEAQSDSSHYRGNKILSETEPAKLMRLDITAETRLPALEELTLRVEGSSYPWDSEHCRLLREAMDTSRLRRLDFGHDMPGAFFSAFAGLLPKLESLRFGILRDGSVSGIKRFIDSLENLNSLDIDRAQLAIEELWPMIMKRKDTLRELILRPTTVGYCVPEYIDIECLKTISIQFPMLERLGWDAPCEENVNPEHLAILRTMNLAQLDLFLHLPDEASLYSAKLKQNAMGTIPAPPLDRDGSRKAAIALLETISEAQTQPLDKLTLHLTRTGYSDRFQPYTMGTKMHLRRNKDKTAMGDAKYEVRGDQSWWGGSQLEEEILFNEE